MNTVPVSFEAVDRFSFGLTALQPLVEMDRREPLDRFRTAAATAPSGAPFFEALLAFLWAVIDPVMLYVGVLEPPGETVRTVVAIRDGKRVENYPINLADTPCAAVLGPQAMCIYTDSVADLFPRTRGLRTMNAEGYVGMPLFARDGTKIGIVTAVTAHPVENIDEIRSALYTFGGRLSLELERHLKTTAGGDTTEIDAAIEAAERALASALGVET